MGESHKRNLFWLLALSPPNAHPKASLNSFQNSRLVFRNLRDYNRSIASKNTTKLSSQSYMAVWGLVCVYTFYHEYLTNEHWQEKTHKASVLLLNPILICQPLVNGHSLPSSRWILLQPFDTRPPGWWIEGQKVGRNK